MIFGKNCEEDSRRVNDRVSFSLFVCKKDGRNDQSIMRDIKRNVEFIFIRNGKKN